MISHNNQALQSADHLSPGLPFTHIDRHTDQSISVQVRKNETLIDSKHATDADH